MLPMYDTTQEPRIYISTVRHDHTIATTDISRTMPKRSRSPLAPVASAASRDHKRPRLSPTSPTMDRLSLLSDELLLRVFSFLETWELGVCQILSSKFAAVATDAQLWRDLYFARFVRPRLRRDDARLRGSRWAEEEGISGAKGKGEKVDWKRQYKLRHNWTRGACAVEEIEVAARPAVPPLLVRMHRGVVYTVDATGGLRVWCSKENRGLLAESVLRTASPPTSLAVDVSSEEGRQHVVIGFEDGSFTIYTFDRKDAELSESFTHPASSSGMLSAVAMCSPYLLTMTASQLLSLYRFPARSWTSPQLVHSLRSHTTWPPLSLGIRSSPSNIIATIAYALPVFLSGWSVGVQELWLSPSGELLTSRLATSTPHPPFPVATAISSAAPRTPMPFTAASPGFTKPTSLSYTHPYLLLSHPDNTLTLYLVTSTASSLSISPGSRLWGHTSSVSGAHVGGRGKAVSVTARGDEVRIWELEGSRGRKSGGGDASVRVREPFPTHHKAKIPLQSESAGAVALGCGFGARMAGADRSLDDVRLVRGWVGFDEENVVLLRERERGPQSLVVYDFR